MALGELKENILDVTGRPAGSSVVTQILPNVFNLSSYAGQNEALLGLESGNNNSLQSRGKALAKHNDETRKRAERSRKSTEDFVFLDTLQRARAASVRLAREVADIEKDYQAQYGDAWREHIAMEVFGEDEVPERKDGESVTEYRERLDREMVERMIDPATSKAKEEYADSPHKRWAEKRYRQMQVDSQLAIAEDESRPQAERDQAALNAANAAVESGSEQNMSQTIARVEQDSEAYTELDDGLDDKMDDSTSTSDPEGAAAFLALPPPA